MLYYIVLYYITIHYTIIFYYNTLQYAIVYHIMQDDAKTGELSPSDHAADPASLSRTQRVLAIYIYICIYAYLFRDIYIYIYMYICM